MERQPGIASKKKKNNINYVVKLWRVAAILNVTELLSRPHDDAEVHKKFHGAKKTAWQEDFPKSSLRN